MPIDDLTTRLMAERDDIIARHDALIDLLRDVWACVDGETCDEKNADGTMYQSADLADVVKRLNELFGD